MLRSDGGLMLSVEEAAAQLGIGRSLAYEAVRTGQIPSVRIGRRLLIPKLALERFMTTGSGEAKSLT
jgi:excisionase family DNA binding protein